MKNTTYKVKESEQEEANLRKQTQQMKLTKQKIEELKRQQLLRKQLDIDV